MRYFPTTSGHDVYDARSPSSVALTPPCATRVTSRHQKRGTAPGAARLSIRSLFEFRADHH